MNLAHLFVAFGVVEPIGQVDNVFLFKQSGGMERRQNRCDIGDVRRIVSAFQTSVGHRFVDGLVLTLYLGRPNGIKPPIFSG